MSNPFGLCDNCQLEASMRKRFASACLIVAVASVSLGAVGGNKAQYIGGTMGVKEKAEGKLDTSGTEMLVFTPDGKKSVPVSIPYKSIKELEYGQKAGRRVGVAIFVSPLALFSKKRNHFLTITYADDKGAEQAGVFELGKDIVRTSLKVIETRSGKDISYQDEDARKSGVGGK
jgi:hypothetical protein